MAKPKKQIKKVNERIDKVKANEDLGAKEQKQKLERLRGKRADLKGKPTGLNRPGLQKADAKNRGAYQRHIAQWKKQREARLAKIRNSSMKPAQKRQALAQVKANFEAKKPAKPTMAGELMADYGYAHAVIYSDPELKKLMREATLKQWDPAKFAARVRDTQWYQSRSEAERNAETMSLADPVTWERKVREKRESIRAMVTGLGGSMSAADLDQFTRDAVSGDWGDSEIQHYIADTYLQINDTGGFFGEAGKIEDALRQRAAENGVQFNDSWYENAVRATLMDDAGEDTWLDEINERSAQTYAPWADKIRLGQTVKDMASPYMQSMAQTLEIPESEVSLFDPTLRKAITNVTDQGDPAVSPLWKFEQDLRKDERWKNTKNAQNTVATSGMEILSQWGLMK